MSFLCEVIEHDAPTLFAYRVVEGPAQMEVRYHVEPLAQGCRFTMSGRGTAAGRFLRLMDPVLARVLTQQIDRALVRLKAVLEGAA